ncbi:MAG: Fic family protein [Clostridia bacterium]|nr:Fic family protein [Clostridia bacterium]
MYDAINSIYTYKNSEVLKNKLDIRSEKKLKQYETEMVSFKLSTIKDAGIARSYDEKHLKAIHKHLFEDVYDFAGEYRKENITKENFRFSEFQYIDDNIKEILNKINLDKCRKMKFEDLVVFISQIMTDLNVLHPFREGNGRATREFIRELLDDLGYEINWFLIDYNDILKASIKAVIDETDQIELLKKSIKKKE